MLVAWVFRMNHDGGIAEHGFRSCRGDGQRTTAIGQRIANMPEETVLFFRQHFQVRYGGVEFRVPVNETLAAVNQTFVVETDKALCHGF